MMKRTVVLLCCLLLAGALCMSGCAQSALLTDPETDDMMQQLLIAIQIRDAVKMQELMPSLQQATDAEIADFLRVASAYFVGDLVSWKKIGQNRQVIWASDGQVTKSNCVYVVKTTQDEYRVTVLRVQTEVQSAIQDFNIVTQEEYTAATKPVGTLDTIGQFNGANWIFLVWTVVVYVFMGFTVARCVRDSIRRKPLWILLIFAQFTFTVSHSWMQRNVHFAVTAFNAAKYLAYPDGSTAITLLLPLGAFIYRGMRDRLLRANLPAVQEEAPGEGMDALQELVLQAQEEAGQEGQLQGDAVQEALPAEEAEKAGDV